jgi:hypothetical protein
LQGSTVGGIVGPEGFVGTLAKMRRLGNPTFEGSRLLSREEENLSSNC